MKQRLLIGKIEGYLRDLCGYGYQNHAEKVGTKPELEFQSKLQELLEADNYEVENPSNIETTELAIQPTLNESDWEIDLKVTNKDTTCYVELKYDELKEEGSSTNPQSEEETLRDIYKLQCIKRTNPDTLCLIVFATNNSKHWEEFLKINAGDYKIPYNGNEEKFKILHSYSIEWKEPLMFEDEGYKYFILEV